MVSEFQAVGPAGAYTAGPPQLKHDCVAIYISGPWDRVVVELV